MKSEIIPPKSSIPHCSLCLSEKKHLPQMAQSSTDKIRNHPSEIRNSFLLSVPQREKTSPADSAEQRR
jgi:hypothetical protein